MKKGRLAPYILVSFLIHTGFLLGTYRFLRLPDAEVESAVLIPVEIVVVREESPASQSGLAPGDRIWSKKALQTKSQIMMETATDRSADDMATPIPKAGGFEPNVTIAGMATTGYIAEAQAGESADSKPIVPASQILPSQISPVAPSAPIETAFLEVKIPAVLVEAKAKLTPADSQTPQKVATPLPGSRPAAEPVFEKPPLAMERHDEPRLTPNTNPMLRDVPKAPEAETIAGKSVIPASQMSPLQFSPADPSPPSTSLPLDVGMPAVPIEAKAATILAYPQSPQKIETPLASRPPPEDLADEHQPIPKEGNYEPVLMVSTLQVQSQPNGAQVYVNDMPIGETPLAWELPLGKYEVRLALPDYYGWDAQVELTPEHKTFPILYRLVPIEETK
jgi:hypothetical protein